MEVVVVIMGFGHDREGERGIQGLFFWERGLVDSGVADGKDMDGWMDVYEYIHTRRETMSEAWRRHRLASPRQFHSAACRARLFKRAEFSSRAW